MLDWGGDSRNEEKQRDPWNIQGVRKVGLAGGLVRGGGGSTRGHEPLGSGGDVLRHRMWRTRSAGKPVVWLRIWQV